MRELLLHSVSFPDHSASFPDQTATLSLIPRPDYYTQSHSQTRLLHSVSFPDQSVRGCCYHSSNQLLVAYRRPYT